MQTSRLVLASSSNRMQDKIMTPNDRMSSSADRGATEGRPRWNHNLEYHRLVLGAIPAGARTALDVGTGDGYLARDLRQRVPEVTAIDADAAVLDRARTLDPGVHWVHGDALTHLLPEAGFDVVASIATLHHFPDAGAALARMAALTAPGGVLVVVGLAPSTTPIDVAYDLAGVVQHRLRLRGRELWEHTAPTAWPPPLSYRKVRRLAKRVLPGVRWRRLLLWRFVLIWRKPL